METTRPQLPTAVKRGARKLGSGGSSPPRQSPAESAGSRPPASPGLCRQLGGGSAGPELSRSRLRSAFWRPGSPPSPGWRLLHSWSPLRQRADLADIAASPAGAQVVLSQGVGGAGKLLQRRENEDLAAARGAFPRRDWLPAQTRDGRSQAGKQHDVGTRCAPSARCRTASGKWLGDQDSNLD